MVRNLLTFKLPFLLKSSRIVLSVLILNMGFLYTELGVSVLTVPLTSSTTPIISTTQPCPPWPD